MPTQYRLSPQVVARVVGAAVLAVALLVLLTTLVVALVDLPSWPIVVVAVVGLLGVSATGWVAVRRGWVLRVTEEGYAVRYVRGVGTPRARWKDVEDAVTVTVAGSPCVVLRLSDGRSTTIPVTMLAIDREQFVRELQEHLRRGHGLRRL